MLTGIQVSLVLLAAPAAAAGSMGMDRARGSLLHMMVTDLSDAEIVVGTLAGRLAPAWGLIVCGVPIMALGALLGGIDIPALAGTFVVSLALALLGCVLALTVSVWVRRTHEVLMAVYMAEALWLLSPLFWVGPAPPVWFEKLNPYVLVFAPYNRPSFVTAFDHLVFAGGVLTVSAALTGLSIARIRGVTLAKTGSPAAGGRRPFLDPRRLFPSWPSPTPDGNPMLWRECHHNRPSRVARRLWAGVLIVCWALLARGTVASVARGVPDGSEAIQVGLGLYVALGLLLLSATAPTVLAEERVRGSLDVLMATPLATRAIVLAKWWGTFRKVLLLLPLPVFAVGVPGGRGG